MPQYKSLKVERLQQFISNYPDTFVYYPDESEIAKLPKQFLVNVAYSILDDLFADWVKEQIEERNAKVAEKGNLMIELDSEIHQAFLESSAVSRKYLLVLTILTLLFHRFSPEGSLREHAKDRHEAARRLQTRPFSSSLRSVLDLTLSLGLLPGHPPST